MRLLHVFFVFITLHGFSQVQKVITSNIYFDPLARI